MSTKVVLPSSSRVSVTSQKSPTQQKPPSAAKLNLLSRLRNPPKPQIQLDKGQLKKQLTPLQYKITQEKFTERPFSGKYLKLNDDGVYCCIVCGEEIFSSECKFDSGCGWPAFSSVVANDKVLLQADLSHIGGNLLLLALNQDLARTEVQCAKCGSHLGHVFQDGPKSTGKRYCVNSASLKFKKESKEDDKFDCDTIKSVTDSIPKSSAEKVVRAPRRRFESKSVERPRNPPPQPPKLTSPSFKSVIIRDPWTTNKTVQISTICAIKQSSNSQHTPEIIIKESTTKLDGNNNAITNVVYNNTPKKYQGVQSRYLNHLEDSNKHNVIKIYTFPKTASQTGEAKKLLETDL